MYSIIIDNPVWLIPAWERLAFLLMSCHDGVMEPSQSHSSPTQENQVHPTAGSKKPPKRSTVSTTLLIICVVLVGLAASIYILGYASEKTPPTTSVGETDERIPSVPTRIPHSSDTVDWLAEPQKVASVGFFTAVDRYYPYRLEYCKSGSDCMTTVETTDSYEPKTTYYVVGTMKTVYPGAKVYITFTKGLLNTEVYKGLGTEKDFTHNANRLALFIHTTDGKFVVPNDYDNWMILCRSLCQNQDEKPKIISESTINYRDDMRLDVAGSTHVYTDRQTNVKYGLNLQHALFNPNGLYLVKDFDDGYQLYSTQDTTLSVMKMRMLVNPSFVLRTPTGLATEVYNGPYSHGLVVIKGPESYGDPYDDTAYLTWTAGSPPALLPKTPSPPGITTDYTSLRYTSDYDGCTGNLTLQNVASDTELINLTQDLQEVGNTQRGDVVYTLKNTDFRVFQQFWFQKVVQNGLSDILPYQAYLDLKPILVWKNSVGVYKLVFRDDLVSSKCWAEPLIYLYPEEETSIRVELSKNISLTESEPPYGKSWQVLAKPDGTLYDLNKQRNYPYLYWEGSAPLIGDAALERIVPQEEVKAYLTASLTKLGLHEKERADFLSYWVPLLTGSPYYHIVFYDEKTVGRNAPLTISPIPDTQIRVMMTYERLSKPVSLPVKDTYDTPKREGFTIVEWGGLIKPRN